MEKMRVLLANDPRVYREVVADFLRRLRPLVEVVVCEPGDMEDEASRFRPHIVVCSEASVAERVECLAWILFYPGGEDLVEFGGGEGASLSSGSKATDLLALVDETELSLTSKPEESPAESA